MVARSLVTPGNREVPVRILNPHNSPITISKYTTIAMLEPLDKLQAFNFRIQHKQGRSHTNADALSQLPCQQCGQASYQQSTEAADSAPPENIEQLQQDDPHIGPILKAKIDDKKPAPQIIQAASGSTKRLFQIWEQLFVKRNCLYRLYQHPNTKTEYWQLIIPLAKREEILRDMHEGTLGGHLGEENTFCRLRERYYWPGYYSDVQHWCRTCASCAARKTSSPKNQASLQNIKVGEPYKEGKPGVASLWSESAEARKFHWSWTGPYRVVRKFSDVTYRLQDTQAPSRHPIVHSDHLKLCPNDMRLLHLQCNNHQPCRTQLYGNRSPPGTHLTVVEQSDSPVPVEQSESTNTESSSQGQQTRYPSRT